MGSWNRRIKDQTLRAPGVRNARYPEKLTYDKYWLDQRYRLKRPNLHSSLKLAYGDNIYHRDPKSGLWLQEPSHHSLDDGSPNPANIEHDTQTEFVLIGAKYTWGGAGPTVPATLRQPGSDLCARRGHKKNWPPQFIKRRWLAGFMGSISGITSLNQSNSNRLSSSATIDEETNSTASINPRCLAPRLR